MRHHINTIIHGDNREYLQEFADNSVDLIVTDPPYEINYQGLAWDREDIDWRFYAGEFSRILKDTGNVLIFSGWSNARRIVRTIESYLTLANWIAWDRQKGRGAKRNLVSTREDILWFTKSEDYTFNVTESFIKKVTRGYGDKNGRLNRIVSNVWTDISPIAPLSPEYCGHPAQKPVKLMARIISIYSNPGDLVLDPFGGSGTTAVAARILDRDSILIEREAESVAMANQRLEALREQGSLFEKVGG